MVFVRREEEPVLAPPPRPGGRGRLAAPQSLLLASANTILTILAVAFLVWIVPPIVRWAFLDAVWTGSDREACLGPDAGACWAFVTAKFAQFMYGRYPIEERWRVDLTAVLLVVGLVPLAIPGVPFKRENIV